MPNNDQGVCIPKELEEDNKNRFGLLFKEIKYSWDVFNAFSKKSSLLYEKYPAYFSFLIGHELGHTKICLLSIALHIHCLLIQYYIEKASNNEISKCHQLPFERSCDQFGIYIAEKLFTRSKINNEIHMLLDNKECKNPKRMEILLSLNLQII